MPNAELPPELRLMPIREAKLMLPYDVSDSTIVRWIRDGIQDFYGRRIRLRCEKAGGRKMVCLKWLNEFRAAIQRPNGQPQELVADGSAERAASAQAELTELLK